MRSATVPEEGFPQATTVGPVDDGLTICFMASKDAQGAQDIAIARNNDVSLALNRDDQFRNDVQGSSSAVLAMSVPVP